MFLLPETRAYIAGATFSENGTLDIRVDGNAVNSLELLVKGAYWIDKKLRHFEARVIENKAQLLVPDDANRIEYYVIDQRSNIYDFHHEGRFYSQASQRTNRSSESKALEMQVRKACQAGEGLHIEFKPFINLDEKTTAKNLNKSKLREVIETVVAFSNMSGGHIYLGINDDCTISGIRDELCAWAREGISETSIERYFGKLRSKIKDLIHGEVALSFSYVEVDGMLVGIIEVLPTTHGPICVQQEFYLYVRSGGSNRKAPPEQWKSVLDKDAAKKDRRLFTFDE